RVAAESEVGIDALLDRGETQFIEAQTLNVKKRSVEVAERASAPHVERRLQPFRCTLWVERPCLPPQPLETFQVELVRTDAKDIAGGARLDAVCAQRLPQRGHVAVE